MPNKDGTGPQGKGPKTGCGTGSCETSNENEGIKKQENKSSEGCGQGRGLKPCGQDNDSDNQEKK